MNPQYKGFNGPSRYSTRRQIFGNRQAHSKQQQNTQILKLQGKMRSIQDDIKTIRSKNQKLEQENTQLLKLLQDLQYNLNAQSLQIEKLQLKVSKEVKSTDQFSKYEQNLKIVAQKINLLNQIIRQKNQEFSHLTTQKRRLQNQKKILKQQSNLLLYNQNIFLEETHQILIDQDDQNMQKEHEDLSNKIMKIILIYENLKKKIQSKRKTIEQMKKETKDMIMNEKQKRIELQFKVKLLKERGLDQEKQRQYYRRCYDEHRIQEVIDEMLIKQDAIRQERNHQIDGTKEFKQQREDYLAKYIKKVHKDRQERSQQLKKLQMKNEMLMKQLQVTKTQAKEYSSKVKNVQTQGFNESDYMQQSDNELWKQIKALEQQNVILQLQYNNLNSQVQMLQKELII